MSYLVAIRQRLMNGDTSSHLTGHLKEDRTSSKVKMISSDRKSKLSLICCQTKPSWNSIIIRMEKNVMVRLLWINYVKRILERRRWYGKKACPTGLLQRI